MTKNQKFLTRFFSFILQNSQQQIKPKQNVLKWTRTGYTLNTICEKQSNFFLRL